jgi:phosphoribosylamine--glycine ligase
VAGRGYPEAAARGVTVESAPDGPAPRGRAQRALLFHASTGRAADGSLVAGGGRCFTAVGLGADLQAASDKAYQTAARVRFDGAWCRGDIGRKFMEARP